MIRLMTFLFIINLYERRIQNSMLSSPQIVNYGNNNQFNSAGNDINNNSNRSSNSEKSKSWVEIIRENIISAPILTFIAASGVLATWCFKKYF